MNLKLIIYSHFCFTFYFLQFDVIIEKLRGELVVLLTGGGPVRDHPVQRRGSHLRGGHLHPSEGCTLR
jgi:hypothetical protein